MRFKIDENLPIEIADLLRQHQHDAVTVPEQQLAGYPDSHVARVCQAEQRAIVTLDLDFSDLRSYPPDEYHGIIVLRPAVQNASALLRLTNRVLALLGSERLDGCLWVVDEGQVRIRGKEEPDP